MGVLVDYSFLDLFFYGGFAWLVNRSSQDLAIHSNVGCKSLSGRHDFPFLGIVVRVAELQENNSRSFAKLSYEI